MNYIKLFIKNCVPPILVRSIQNVFKRGIRFKGNYKTWEEALALSTGYDSTLILNKVLDATLKVKHGESAFERDAMLFNEIQYSWPITAALMWTAARNNGELHVLDFGGSLGSSYFQNRKFLSELKIVSWHIIEQPHFVEKGKIFIEDDILKFYSSIEDAINIKKPNAILISSSAQYLSNPQWLFDKINSIEADVLLFDRTPFTHAADDILCIQDVPSTIYKASYPIWLLSRNKLLRNLSNWQVYEKFPSLGGCLISEVGIEFEFSGYIFKQLYA